MFSVFVSCRANSVWIGTSKEKHILKSELDGCFELCQIHPGTVESVSRERTGSYKGQNQPHLRCR